MDPIWWAPYHIVNPKWWDPYGAYDEPIVTITSPLVAHEGQTKSAWVRDRLNRLATRDAIEYIY